jgi:predicted O-linked N-acetylglucosamine transferase (SPINDLY family)
MQCCDWTAFHSEAAAVERDVKAGKRSAGPFGFQVVSQSPESLYLCSRTYAADKYPPRSALWSGERYANPKIRLGYLAGEFRTHATSILMAGLFECHDRKRFELYAFDSVTTRESDAPARRKIVRFADRYFRMSDLDAAGSFAIAASTSATSTDIAACRGPGSSPQACQCR